MYHYEHLFSLSVGAIPIQRVGLLADYNEKTFQERSWADSHEIWRISTSVTKRDWEKAKTTEKTQLSSFGRPGEGKWCLNYVFVMFICGTTQS